MNAIGMPEGYAAAAFRQPSREVRWSLGFLGLLFYLIVEYTSLPSMYPVLEPLHLGKIAVALAALGYLVAPRSRTAASAGSKAIDAAVALLLFSGLFSSLLAGTSSHAWAGYWDFVKWLVIYFLVSRLLTNRWRLQIFLILLLLLNLKMAQFAIRGYASARGAGYSGMEIIKLGGASAGTTAFFGNANDFGLAMCVVWGLTWALFFRKKQNVFLRLFLAVCFTAFLLAILVCGSRGAIVGATAIVLAATLRTPKRARALILGVLFLCSVIFIMPGAVVKRFDSALNWRHDPNTYSRIMLWEAGLSMWTHHPVFGVGPGNFPYAFASNLHDLSLFPDANKGWVAHSLYVQSLAELGLAGFLPLLGAIFLSAFLNAKTRKEALTRNPLGRGSLEYCLAAGLDLAMVGYLVSGAFLAVLYYPHLWILLGLSVAVNRACLSQPAAPAASAAPAAAESRGRKARLSVATVS
ncbi:MAG TPA: O-antigen ligase family protein [Patescibacteria group bacterium]|nr:O-antigen ligase family protein [Patescibacteria group bacterium]